MALSKSDLQCRHSMTLEDEIRSARTDIVSDGYEMSVGEIINLYRDGEIHINPDFQRLFRWDISRKTKFIESILLGIPIPPIFVYQNENGIWELIDGLQRLSTLLEFVGLLRKPDGHLMQPSVMEGTRILPNLAGKKWEQTSQEENDGIGQFQQLQIKRSRIRVEILKQESDPKAKYELFQRLNTGGAILSEQEVRNCIAIMIDKEFFNWLKTCSKNPNFLTTIDQTDHAMEKQIAMELVLRFFVYRAIPYQSGLDVHEYLDEGMIKIARNPNYDREAEKEVFHRTFQLLNHTMGKETFKKWDGIAFKGKFLISLFEVIALGVSRNISAIENLDNSSAFIQSRCKELWNNPTFHDNSGAGVRGTTRLANLLTIAEECFKTE